MAKRSRTRLTSQGGAASDEPVTSRRAQRRHPVRRAHERTFLDRYGSWLLIGLVGVGVLLIGYVVITTGTQAAYACTAELTPGPTEPNPTPRPSPTASPSASPAASGVASPSPAATTSPAASATASAAPSASPSASPAVTLAPTEAPQPTARLGFTTTNMGRSHVPRPQQVTYAFCPPTSGSHYNDAQAPMKPAVYPPTTDQAPGNWIHDLEHGYVVVTYRCPSGVIGQGDCISEAEFAQLNAWFAQAPAPTKSQCTSKALVVRSDSTSTRFAILAWNRALLIDQFDLPTALTFAQQWMEHDAVPEASSC